MSHCYLIPPQVKVNFLRLLKKLLLRVRSVSWLLLLFSHVYAAGSSLDAFATNTNIPIDPTQAFRVTAVLESETQARLDFNIMPNFYIYKDRLTITSSDPEAFNTASIHLPSGFKMNIFDGESYSEETVLNNSFRIVIPLQHKMDKLNLLVRLQGCDGKTVCYPPQNYSFELDNQRADDSTFAKEHSASLFGHLKDLFVQVYSGGGNILANPFELFLIFFLAGFAISLTPCMYPLYPIALSAISKTSTRRSSVIKLTLCYIHGIALIYVLMGIIAAFSGHLLITLIQTPIFVMISSGILLILGLAMFDLLEIKLPNRLHNFVHLKSANLDNGRHFSAFVLGILSSLLLGPCVTPPLIIAIGFIASSAKVINGILGLYAISLGMGLPILVLATVGNKLLPKSGAWMSGVKYILGIMIIGLAIYLAYPLINLGNTLLSIGVLCYITALIFLLVKHFRSSELELLIHSIMPILMIIIGLVFTLLSSDRQQLTGTIPTTENNIVSLKQVDNLIQASQMPVLIIVSAKWCSICRELEATTFKDPEVMAKFKQYSIIHFDITENTSDSTQFLHQYHLYGPPAIIILGSDKRVKDTLTGYINAKDLLKHL